MYSSDYLDIDIDKQYCQKVGENTDRSAIAATQNAYAVAIDNHDWEGLRRCFLDDAVISFGIPRQLGGPEEFIAWAPSFHESFARTLHQTSTHASLSKGDTANASCYLHALLIDLDEWGGTEIFGRYDDTLVRVDGTWRFKSRTFSASWRHSLSSWANDG